MPREEDRLSVEHLLGTQGQDAGAMEGAS